MAEAREQARGRGVTIVRPRKVWSALRAALVFNAVFASVCAAADFTQHVFRINPVAGEARPSETLDDCLEGEFCQTQLLFALGRIGGNPGQLLEERTPPRIVRDGDIARYDFAPENGQRFCRAELVKLSIAPSFGANAPSMRFEASRDAAAVTVRVPSRAPRAWFDGILILIASSSSDGCTLTARLRIYDCVGRCETVRF